MNVWGLRPGTPGYNAELFKYRVFYPLVQVDRMCGNHHEFDGPVDEIEKSLGG